MKLNNLYILTFLLFACVFCKSQSICVAVGLQDVDEYTSFKLTAYGATYTNKLCVSENEYYVVIGWQMFPTCVGYSPDYLDVCDESIHVCCGDGYTSGTYGYPSAHKSCLDEAFTTPDNSHPYCPSASSTPTRSPSPLPSFSLTSAPTQSSSPSPSSMPSITEYFTITLTLMNVQSTPFNSEKYQSMLFHGLKTQYPLLEDMKVTQAEQFLGFSMLNLDVRPPIPIFPETQSNLASYLLERDPSLAIQSNDIYTSKTNAEPWMYAVIGVLVILILITGMLLVYYVTRDDVAYSIGVEGSTTIVVEPVISISDCELSLAPQEIIIEEGGSYFSEHSVEHLKLPVEGFPHASSYACRPSMVFPETPHTHNEGQNLAQTPDSTELYSPISPLQYTPDGHQTLKFTI